MITLVYLDFVLFSSLMRGIKILFPKSATEVKTQHFNYCRQMKQN